jgi:heme A synthase
MLHARAFKVTVGWTLVLLYVGSVVHATGSSLACPDWPTCFGTMVPEMSGGVFWEHLHRLVAGGLLMMFALGTWLAKKEATDRPWVFRVSLAGMALLVVQSVFGGLTVLYRLPDFLSTTHLALAFLFLALTTVLASSTGTVRLQPMPFEVRLRARALAVMGAGLVFVQSVLGALVRHMDAGMACPDVPLCLGQVVPPLVNAPITVHFTHRVLALIVGGAVVGISVWARRAQVPDFARGWLDVAAILVVVQVGLGVASVMTVLSVAAVSLHTLVAATLVAALVRAATLAHMAPRSAAAPAAVVTV